MMIVPLCVALVLNCLTGLVRAEPGGVQQPQTPVHLNSIDPDRPARIKEVPAIYPANAPELRGLERAVQMDITIGLDGKVTDARPAARGNAPGGSSLPIQIAIEAVRQWEYEPPTVKGEPTPVIVTVQVNVVEERARDRARRQSQSIPQAWTYVDATMAATYDKTEEIESPLTVLTRKLKEEGFRCLSSRRANSFGTIEGNHLSTKVYLVECSGDCSRLSYGVAVAQNGQVRHLGANRGYPLVEVRVPFLVDAAIRWQFSRPDRGLPQIRVHEFTKVPTESGGGCEIAK